MKSEVYLASVGQINKIGDNLLHIIVNIHKEKPFRYAAGQYIDMVLEDGKCRTFSIASSPDQGHRLEFFLRDVENGLLESLLTKHCLTQTPVNIIGPKGDYELVMRSAKPLIFLAGGSGFAPIKSLLEYGVRHGLSRKVSLYWGARTREELYFDLTLRTWAQAFLWFEYIPVLTDETWAGRMGYVHHALLEDRSSLAGLEVYASGSPQMIKSVYEALVAQGLGEEDFYSDILDYARTLS